MPDPMMPSVPFYANPDSQAWLQDMQLYFMGNPKRGKKGMKMPKAGDYGIDPDAESIGKILMALFAGDDTAYNAYRTGQDPYGLVYWGPGRSDLQSGVTGVKIKRDPVGEADKMETP